MRGLGSARMRILLVGAGGVGTAFARIAARRPFAELVIADYDLARAQRAASVRDGYEAVQLDARDERAVLELLTQRHCDALMNATDPRFVMPLFRAALQAGTHYLDMAMSLSHPDRDDPYSRTGVKLGDDQFAMAPAWEWAGKLALVGMGVEPGLSDVFARYAADELFSQIDELGHAGAGDDRPDLRGHLGHRHRGRRGAARGVPASRGGQRLVDGGVRVSGGGLADRGQAGGRAGTPRLGSLVRYRHTRPGSAAAAAVPGPAHRVRLIVGMQRTRARGTLRSGA
jgi:hypothetical protein